uniref:STAS domain-containing protein n=1 Tax=Marivita sp. TaxID=2003365 RepID=UPI003F6CA822
ASRRLSHTAARRREDLQLKDHPPCSFQFPRMYFKETDMASVKTFDLPPKATITECGAVLTSLRQLVETETDIVVTCSQVEQIDLAMLQVLISARKTAERNSRSFAVVSDGHGTFDAVLAEYGICFAHAA